MGHAGFARLTKKPRRRAGFFLAIAGYNGHCPHLAAAPGAPTIMKQLVRKPFFLALLLSLPLWIVFNNYIVAIMGALLVAFLLSMCHSLYVLGKSRPDSPTQAAQAPPVPARQSPFKKRS